MTKTYEDMRREALNPWKLYLAKEAERGMSLYYARDHNYELIIEATLSKKEDGTVILNGKDRTVEIPASATSTKLYELKPVAL